MSGTGRYMGVDHGSVRIGIALSDQLRMFARPYTILTHESSEADFAAIGKIVEQEQVVKIVVGLPTDSNSSIGGQAQVVIRWALRLAPTLHAPIVLWDESYSSESALETQRIVGKRTKTRGSSHPRLDDVAAARILQDYLDAGGAEDEPGWPLENFSHYG